jgi:hypothetical protein
MVFVIEKKPSYLKADPTIGAVAVASRHFHPEAISVNNPWRAPGRGRRNNHKKGS